ncbi:Glycosyl hydrolase family protein with chitinase insertion domain-containing protein [Perilla frutescens var. hirtella]|nr:Glycosyl hydrolase family protein with chitinase insertion domain-containing protein [Perilla frutescens var. hirtella]KAH6811553.1 Glycosyl hydrolase family protein with chitinase insertion domain-containing protein [Perilla frutescens var. frutescens]
MAAARWIALEHKKICIKEKLIITSILSCTSYRQWRLLVPGTNGFDVSNIDSSLFTHLLCTFADLDPSTNQVIVSSSNTAAFSQFTATGQSKNPSIKTLLSIGGGNATRMTPSPQWQPNPPLENRSTILQ